MAITGVPSVGSGSNNSSQGSGVDQLGQGDFLKLLVEQLKHQDPLDPVKQTDFTAQLAQFSTLDGITKLNQNSADQLLLQQLGQGANLVGKTISYVKNGNPRPLQGVVGAVTVDNGKLKLNVGSDTITIDQVRSILPPKT